MKHAIAALNAPTGHRDLDVDRVVLRDSKGIARFLLMVMRDGTLLLGMFGEDQMPGALLAVEKDGKAGIELYDGEKIRTQLRLVKGGNEALIFFDANEQMRSVIGLDAEGKSVVGLWDDKGSPAWGSRA